MALPSTPVICFLCDHFMPTRLYLIRSQFEAKVESRIGRKLVLQYAVGVNLICYSFHNRELSLLDEPLRGTEVGLED